MGVVIVECFDDVLFDGVVVDDCEGVDWDWIVEFVGYGGDYIGDFFIVCCLCDGVG